MISISPAARVCGEPRCRGNDKIYTFFSALALRSTPPENNLGDLFYDDKDGTSGACLGQRRADRLYFLTSQAAVSVPLGRAQQIRANV